MVFKDEHCGMGDTATHEVSSDGKTYKVSFEPPTNNKPFATVGAGKGTVDDKLFVIEYSQFGEHTKDKVVEQVIWLITLYE
jgi:hypothetical protein